MIGVRRQQLLIRKKGVKTPLLVLVANIRARANAPRVIFSPKDVRIHCIRSDCCDREIVVTTVELVAASNFVESVSVEPPDACDITISDVREHPAYDSQFVKRSYRIKLSVPKQSDSIQNDVTGRLHLNSRDKQRVVVASIPFDIRFANPVTPVPASMEFRHSVSGSAAVGVVRLVRRVTNAGKIRIADFDTKFIDVRQVAADGPDADCFEVRVKSFPKSATNTYVLFALGGELSHMHQIRVVVRLIP